ncbi:MAG: ABC transporter substrate-binding protein [Nitrososphaerales archaeon]
MKRILLSLIIVALLSSMTVPLGALPSAFAASPSSTVLTVGEVGTSAASFSQIGLHAGDFIPTTGTEVPYLYVSPFALNGSVVPGICNVPATVPGTNYTQWIVNLIASNMKWSDGVPINSTDLAYSYGIFLPTGPYANLSEYDPWGAISGTVSSVTILNSTAVKLKMSSPDPNFAVLDALYQIYPEHYFIQYTGANVLTKTAILNGPGDTAYIPSDYTAGSLSFTLVPNPNSPSWTLYGNNHPTISKIVVNQFTTDSSLVNALAAGSVDIGWVQLSDIQALSSLKVDTVPSTLQFTTWIGTVGYPFNNTAFRQALLYLLPKQQIDNQLYNGSLTLGNPIELLAGSSSPYWPGPQTPTYNYSTSQAITHLQKAGLTQNSAGKWIMPNGTAVQFTVTVDNGDPVEVRAAQMIQSSMQGVGLQVNLQTTAPATSALLYHSANYQVFVWDAFNTLSPTPIKYLKNVNNYPNFRNNATFNMLLREALTNTNATAALQEMKQAELIFADAASADTLVNLPYYIAYNSQKFTNLQPGMTLSVDNDGLVSPITAEPFFVSVQPVGLTTSSTSTTSPSVLPTGSTSGVTTASHSSASTTSSTATSASSSAYLIAAAAVIIIIIIAGTLLYMRARRKSPPAR